MIFRRLAKLKRRSRISSAVLRESAQLGRGFKLRHRIKLFEGAGKAFDRLHMVLGETSGYGAKPRKVGKVGKVPPRAAPKGGFYCFKVPSVLGSTAEARWKEKLYALLT